MAPASQLLRRRLMGIMLLTSAAAIVLTCSALILYELITTRGESLQQVATLARIVSANSTAALAFRDDQDAQEVLATLRTEPSIVAAALYDEDGKPFATYAAGATRGEAYPQQLGADGYSFSAGRLEGSSPSAKGRTAASATSGPLRLTRRCAVRQVLVVGRDRRRGHGRLGSGRDIPGSRTSRA